MKSKTVVEELIEETKKKFEKRVLVGNRTIEQAPNALIRADEAWYFLKSSLTLAFNKGEEEVKNLKK